MGLEERTQTAGPRPDRPHARADWRQMVGVGVIASALGIAAGLLINWFPVSASKEAKRIDTLWDVLIIFSVPVFVGVTVVVLFSVLKFRMRPGEENLDGPPIHGNTRLEVVWTAIPAIVLVGLCTYAFVVLDNVEATGSNPVNVRVVGEQFAWTFFYTGPDGKEIKTASRQLHVPIDRQVKFTIQSKDVLHDFWVPAFRMKKDAVPGIDVSYRVTPNRLGSYPIVCAELCGLGHAVMRSQAVVDTPEKFDAWLAALGKPAAPAGGGGGGGGAAPAADGKAIFTGDSNCGTCHTLADAGTTGSIGPNLDTALKGKDAAFIKQSIVDPSAEVAKGYQDGIMPPNFGQTLTPAEIDALVKYLSEVTKGG
jgi:cytochrome c oxidase subunit 2